MDLELNSLNSDTSEDEGDGGVPRTESTSADRSLLSSNYLTPGSLLKESCNGSDVFLKKQRAVSMSFPTIFAADSSPGSNGDAKMANKAAVSKGGPTRFLIVFPGRMSLNPPTSPPLQQPEDGDRDDDDESDGQEYEKNDGEMQEVATESEPKKRKPPARSPRLLGKLLSLGGDEQRIELRIPFPIASSNATINTNASQCNGDNRQPQQLRMSGRAVPLSGKYMAISFKRGSVGNRDFSATSTPRHKKRGTGSILCKDVFRSVIVMGESKLVDQEGRAMAPVVKEIQFAGTAAVRKESGDSSNSDGDEKEPMMNHYGGSERTLDGGGRHDGEATCGRKNSKAPAAAATRKRIMSRSSEISTDNDYATSDSEDVNMQESTIEDEGSDGEFVLPTTAVTAAKKKLRLQNSTGLTSRNNSGKDKEGEKGLLAQKARKRTPRRSAANSVSYLDENSDVDMVHLSSDDEKSDDSSSKWSKEEDNYEFQPRSKSRKKKLSVKESVTKVTNAKKTSPKLSADSEKDTDSKASHKSNNEAEKEKEVKTPKHKSKAKAKISAGNKTCYTPKIVSKRMKITSDLHLPCADDDKEDTESDNNKWESSSKSSCDEEKEVEFRPKENSNAKKTYAKQRTKNKHVSKAKSTASNIKATNVSHVDKNNDRVDKVDKGDGKPREKRPDGKKSHAIKKTACKNAKESIPPAPADKKKSVIGSVDKERVNESGNISQGEKAKTKAKKKTFESTKAVTEVASAAKATGTMRSERNSMSKQKSITLVKEHDVIGIDKDGASTEPVIKRAKKSPSTSNGKNSIAKKDLSSVAMKKSPILTSPISEKSPISLRSPKRNSPIVRGRRKKKSPPRIKSVHGEKNDLDLDDDPFTFL